MWKITTKWNKKFRFFSQMNCNLLNANKKEFRRRRYLKNDEAHTINDRESRELGEFVHRYIRAHTLPVAH